MLFVLIGVFSLLIEICHLFRFCSLSTVIHNPHKIWSENVAFDNTFITNKSLKLYLNLSWFKLFTISPKKPAIYSSRYLQSMKRQLQAAILKGHLGLTTRLKTSSLNFPFSWLVFVIGFNNKLYNLFFHFHVFHEIFIKIMAENKELIFLAQGTHRVISLLLYQEFDLFWSLVSGQQ